MLGLAATFGMIAFLSQSTSQVAEQRVFLQEVEINESLPEGTFFTDEENTLRNSNYFCTNLTDEVIRASLDTLNILDKNKNSLVTFDEVHFFNTRRRTGFERVTYHFD